MITRNVGAVGLGNLPYAKSSSLLQDHLSRACAPSTPKRPFLDGHPQSLILFWNLFHQAFITSVLHYCFYQHLIPIVDLTSILLAGETII